MTDSGQSNNSGRFRGLGVCCRPITIRYRKIAAKQALNRHAYPEAVAQLTRALDMLKRLPESTERDQIELKFLLLLGPCLIATGGYATQEVEQIFNRAQVWNFGMPGPYWMSW
jgi:hypothetical protein